MTAETWFTRREGDTLSRRVDQMDRDGTRGMDVIAAQTRQNAESVGRLQQELHERFAEHTRQHDQETRRRVSGRRWLIGAWIAAGATCIAGLSLLLAIFQTVSHLHR